MWGTARAQNKKALFKFVKYFFILKGVHTLMKKLNNKGFTLIEIVIVIVIIAILAAMLVPSLTQWIDKSKMKTFTSACGTIRTAVASQLSEKYATDSSVTFDSLNTDDWNIISNDVGKTVQKGSNAPAGGYAVSSTNGVDSGFVVKDGKFTGTWNGSAWNVE